MREQLRREQLLHDRLLLRREQLLRKLAARQTQPSADMVESQQGTEPISLTNPPDEVEPEYASAALETQDYESPPPPRRTLRLRIAENTAPVHGYANEPQYEQQEYAAPPEPVFSPPPPRPQPVEEKMPDPPVFSYGPRPIGPLSTLPGLEIGVQASRYTYHEKTDGSPFMNEKGWKIGIEPTYTITLARDWFFRGEGSFAYGPVEYSSGSGESSNENQAWELRGVVGKDYFFTHFGLSPYIGYGYRYLSDDLRAAGPGGYRRKSTYHYFPLGVTHRVKLVTYDPVRIATNLEYDYFASGRQLSYLADVNPADSTLVNRQHKGDGFRGSFTFEFPVWSMGPWFHLWNIADSDTACSALTCGMEPHNRTIEAGFKVSRKIW